MWRPWEVAECVPLDYTIVRVVVFITPIIQYSNTPCKGKNHERQSQLLRPCPEEVVF